MKLLTGWRYGDEVFGNERGRSKEVAIERTRRDGTGQYGIEGGSDISVIRE